LCQSHLIPRPAAINFCSRLLGKLRANEA
jgi:hypothetical protein